MFLPGFVPPKDVNLLYFGRIQWYVWFAKNIYLLASRKIVVDYLSTTSSYQIIWLSAWNLEVWLIFYQYTLLWLSAFEKKNPDVIIKKSQMRRTKLAFWVHSHFSYRNLRLYLNKQIFLHSSLLLLYYYNCLFCEKSQFFNRHVWYRKRMSAKEKKFLPKKKFLHKMHQVQKIFCTDFSPAMCAFTKIPLRQYILYRVFFME